jgi:hypothetical protein
MIPPCKILTRQHLNKDEYELTLNSELDMTEETFDKTDKEDEDGTQQAPVPPHQGT